MGPKRKVHTDEQPASYHPKPKRSRLTAKKAEEERGIEPHTKNNNQSSRAKNLTKSVLKVESNAAKDSQDFKSDPLMLSGPMFIGAHVSAAGGVHNAVKNAVSIGCKSFALFLSSQRQWNAKALEPTVIKQFKEEVEKAEFDVNHILPHGSYLMNCGSPQPETLQKSRAKLVSELQRCELLGLTRYNFHPGSTCGKIPVEKSVELIAESINLAHKETKSVMAVLENMSRQGNTLGGKFEELAAIIDKVDDKSRVGVCIDTCHAFAAGFDIRTKEGWNSLLTEFDDKIGLQYFQAMHLNDSKGELNSHLDRHEVIGKKKGKIGLEVFKTIVNDSRCANIPLVLETPAEEEMANWEREIKLLYSLVK